MSIPTPAHILVIDEIPLIAVGLREVFRSIHPTIQLEHTESIFTALSAPSFQGTPWQLIILGSSEESAPGSLLLPAAELKAGFPGSRVLIYTDRFDAAIISKVEAGEIDAYVHKYESVDEMRKAYQLLSAGRTYVSGMFHTLYYDYGFGVNR